jgi:type II secretory pathway pseudopilin PulG
MLRVLKQDRSSWSLVALLVRLAQAMNLHRDGDGSRFTPYEAEMRRRLWYFIVLLDIRSAEDRGSDAIISIESYNTAKATPIDDEAFGPDAVGPLVPKTSGPADNVFTRCTTLCSGFFGWVTHPHTHASDDPQQSVSTEEELYKQVRVAEDSFIHAADPDHLTSMYAAQVARMVILKLWLTIQYPFAVSIAPSRPRASRETMLRTALSVIEISENMMKPPWEGRFSWWTQTFPQWHPLAVALAELCVLTQGELVDKAWDVVDTVFPIWRGIIADTARGRLWTPIRKLMRKAKAARANALMKSLNIEDPALLLTAQQQQQQQQQQQTRQQQIQQQQHQQQVLPTSSTTTPPFTTAPSWAQSPTTTTMATPEQPPPPTVEDVAMGMTFTAPFDTFHGDVSYLFEYPPELGGVGFDDPTSSSNAGGDVAGGEMDWSPWNDFLNDTKLDYSPEGSGGGSSSDTF